MKHYTVSLRIPISQGTEEECYLDFTDDTPQEEIDRECESLLWEMLRSNGIESSWELEFTDE